MSKTFFLFAGSLSGILLAFLCVLLFSRPVIKWLVAYLIKVLMSDRYTENLWEVVTATTRIHPMFIVENSLRATTGKVIERPFGSPRKFLHFDGLIFSPAQLAILPSHESTKVDTTVVIGPNAKKPLKLDIPLLIGAMGYGIGVTEKVNMAFAKATAAVGTATNTGEGGFLPEVRKSAKHLIIQYHTAKWTKEPEILQQADCIEIHFGQGASAAAASVIPPKYMQGKARDILGLEQDETAVIPNRYPNINKPEDLGPLVQYLREVTGGVPIGVKISAGNRIEEDLEIAFTAEVDFVAIDGGQAGTKGAPPVLEDDFGLPTIFALCRAAAYFEKRNKKGKVSLLIGGGFINPGECLKALALGADAVYLGTAPLWAMTHSQIGKTMPFEPPTQLVSYSGTMTEEFDEEEAAYYLRNFLLSFVKEMNLAVISLGKTAIHAVNAGDLVSLNQKTCDVTKVPLAYFLR